MPSFVTEARSRLMRHRLCLQDLSLLVAALLVTAYVLYDIDVFVSGSEPGAGSIEADELPILGAVLSVGLFLFAWRRSVLQKRETRRRLAAEQEIRVLAFQDPLTGLPNRHRFAEALKIMVGSPPRHGGAHALLMIDLNGFKQINDLHGHNVGDQVLVTVGQRLLGILRPGDMVARLGGDEFAILVEHLSGPEAATGTALRVLDALSQPIAIGSTQHSVGAGIGICVLPFDGATPEEAMRRADIAMYRAKAEAKPAIRYFDKAMDERVRERDLLEQGLRKAVAAGAIEPFFQPLVELRSKKVVGFEALARWQHPGLGDVPPERFIPIAEDSGLIHDLTMQLLRKACAAACSWPADTILAFNISPLLLKNRALPLQILSLVAELELAPGRLEIEITESALVRDLDAAQTILGALREGGIRIALDDFGTGYSSLYHLRNFKLDKIKIDRSFVQTMHSERESAEIVSALLGLGRGLALTVTAEGIEGEGEEADLLTQGCEQGQGFLFGPAVPATETAAFFSRASATEKTNAA